MQALWDVLIRRLAVNDGFEGRFFPTHLHIAPVVFLGIVLDGVVSVSVALPIAAVPALKHIEVQPFTVVVPPGTGRTATGVERHHMV